VAKARSLDRRSDSIGGELDRGDWPWLATLLIIGCLALGGFAVTAQRLIEAQPDAQPSLSKGVPLDDAWIHFQFARNLARGDGFAFNPGQPTAGSTAPLWTVLLAGLYGVGGRFPQAGQLLSAACFLGVLGATYALTKRLTGERWAAWLAGAVVAVNGRMVWAGLSGLETSLFAALSLVALVSHLNDRQRGRLRLRTAALFGLAALVRPEGFLLFLLALVDHAVSAVLSRPTITDVTSRLSSFLPAAGVFGALVLPYLLFSLRTAGHLLPNTFSAKATVDLRPDLDFLSLAARYLILDNPPLLPFVILGVGALFGRARLLSAWTVGLPLAYAFLHADLYQHGRYLMPLIPCHAAAGVLGLLEAGRLARRRGWRWRGARRTLVIFVALVAVGGTAWRLPAMAKQFAANVDNINQMHVSIGRWVVENTPPGARLALNDIGAIAYVSEREVIDLAGLVTPEVVPLLRTPDPASGLIDFLRERRVDTVIIFPNWFPSLAAREDLLTPLYKVTLENRTITGGETMVVYGADWAD